MRAVVYRLSIVPGEVYSYNLRDGRVLADPKAASRASTTRWVRTLQISIHHRLDRKEKDQGERRQYPRAYRVCGR